MSKKILALSLAILMVVLAVPFVALPAVAEEPEILTETWDGGASAVFSESDRNIYANIPNFYQWYTADGQPLVHYTETDVVMDPDGYAELNPVLVERGILDPAATYEEQLEQYREYLHTCGKITYTGNWSVGAYHGGQYQKIDSRALIFQGQHLYNMRVNSKGVLVLQRVPLSGTYLSTAAAVKPYIDEYIDFAKDFLSPGEDGRLYYSEIAEHFSDRNVSETFSKEHSATWTWGVGEGVVQLVKDSVLPNGDLAFNLRPANPGSTASGVAFGYTVPEGVYGTAKLSIESIKCYSSTSDPNKIESGPSKFAVVVNDKGVWPEGVDISNTSTFSSISATSKNTLNAAFADLEFDVKAGDVVSLVIVRDTVVCMDMRPTISIEKKCAVEFQDKDGNVLLTEVVEPGTALPALPYGCAAGFYLNGATEAVSELPATVTENLTVKYAGDFTVQDITLARTAVRYQGGLSIDLYLACDPYAVKGGANVDGLDQDGVKQEDGTYKVTISNIAVRDMVEDIYVYPYHDFADGDSLSSPMEGYAINPMTEISKAKTAAPDIQTDKLMTALLDYATAANAYFNGETVDAETEARLAAQDAAIAALAKDVAIEDDYYDYTIKAATLVLKEQVAIKIAVQMTEWSVLEERDLALSVEADGETYEGFALQAGSADTAMVITLGGIDAADFDTAFDIAVMDGLTRESATVSYSVNAYIARTFEGGAGETDNLLRALYALGVAAEAMNG